MFAEIAMRKAVNAGKPPPESRHVAGGGGSSPAA